MTPHPPASTPYAASSTGVLLLAAGASSRLGRPKQLLPFAGQTLLQHALKTALGAEVEKVVLVLGAGADGMEALSSDPRLEVVVNTDWEEGMASSIRFGMGALQQVFPGVESVLITVCDQPFVTPELLNELIRAHHITLKPIVACAYAGTFGPPVLFHKEFFPRLLQLSGDVGARGLVRQYEEQTELIPFPEGNVDVDTERDYEN